MSDAVRDGAELARRIDALEAFLRERSQPLWAERLRDAVAGGATGTETLVRVSVELDALGRSRVARDLGCAVEARSLRGAIARHLRRI